MPNDDSSKVTGCSTFETGEHVGTDDACSSSSSSSKRKIDALDSDELESDLVAVNKSNKAELAGVEWDVPLWLQCSDLYRNTLSMGLNLHCDLFTNSPHIRENSDIYSVSDFVSVMLCVDYWGVDYRYSTICVAQSVYVGPSA